MHIRRWNRRSLGRQFGWLWAAYAVSAYGTGIGFGAFPLIAIRVLHSGPVEVSALSAAGLAVGAVVAVPLGPWVEFRRKRPVMMAMDLTRFAALMTIPAAYALGWLSFAQLLVVAVVVAAAKIAFNAASGANIKTLVKPEDLLVANSRFESTTWTTLVVGPPLGGAAVGLLGPVTTVHRRRGQLPALCLRGRHDRRARAAPGAACAIGRSAGELLDGWRHILGSPALRPVFFNRLLVGGLILAVEPELAVLMLGPLKFAPWQYTLAFGAPCIGGLIGSRLSPRLVARFGRHRVMLVFGTLSACWPVGLAFTGPPRAASCSSSPCSSGSSSAWACTTRWPPPTGSSTRRSTWSPGCSRPGRCRPASITAALTAAWGGLATLTSPRDAIAAAGVLLLVHAAAAAAPRSSVPDLAAPPPA